MISVKNLKNLSFLVYGLGLTGKSVVKFFIKNKIKDYHVWDDKNKNLYKKKRVKNLNYILKKVDFIILSPGVSLKKTSNKKKLSKFENKIITDIDLLYLSEKKFKSIVVTGTNGKSTTCKILDHVLKKNRIKTLLGGNIGIPILDHNIRKNNFLIIEASSFQLSHSKFISPDYAMLLNITNDHLDWHGSMNNYKKSKLKIFKLQKKNQYALINKRLKSIFKINKFKSKLIIPRLNKYLKFKDKIKNAYLKSKINDENMSFIFEISKLLKIKEKSFLKSIDNFEGLPHRYEFFLKKKNCIFINDSKATSFKASKVALENSENIFWIVGGLPKKNDLFQLSNLKKRIIKAYIIGENLNFFKNQIEGKVNFSITKNLQNSIKCIFKDIKLFKKKYNIILFSPASASYDQFLNFEKRGETFKKLSKFYARKYL